MSVKWIMKQDLKKTECLADMKKNSKEDIPEVLLTFIQEHNAAIPDKQSIKVSNEEQMFYSVLDFNDSEIIKSAMFAINDETMIPFGRDPFGNYFCYSLKTNTIVFYEHEEEKIVQTEYTLDSLIDNLF